MDIPKTNFTGLYVVFEDLATRASGKSAAVGSLVIAELDDRNLCVFSASKVAGLLRHQLHHLGGVRISRGSDGGCFHLRRRTCRIVSRLDQRAQEKAAYRAED